MESKTTQVMASLAELFQAKANEAGTQIKAVPAATVFDADCIRQVVQELQRIGGGICIAEGGNIKGSLPLPVGGLMTNAPAQDVADRQGELVAIAREMGVPEFYSPFLTLAFLSLPVIPSLKLTDRGLVDVDAFGFVPLEVK